MTIQKKELTLQTNGYKNLAPAVQLDEISITLRNSFNCKQVVFWLTKKGTDGISPVVKTSISNYSSTLASQSNYKFKIFSEDAVIHEVMYCPNFYDFDSEQYHKIMLQEKLKGSYMLQIV